MKIINLIWLFFLTSLICQAQTTQTQDLNYVLENLQRTRDELIKETENLTLDQWNFKESPDRWSIANVVEHLSIWEILWSREVGIGLNTKPTPELNETSRPDSYYSDFIMEEKKHDSSPISQPRGFMKGKENLDYFVKLRNENIKYAEKITKNLRDYFELTGTSNPRNMYQVYIYQWGHVDRHLRQIKKLKEHANYPKITTGASNSSELTAILETIDKSTERFFKRDFNGWKETWAQTDYAFQAWNNSDGTFEAKVGWDEINEKTGKYILNNPVPTGTSSHPKVERRNIVSKFYGENMAYLIWDQYNSTVDLKRYKVSKEVRIMEKIDGTWKIVNVSAFWDSKNLIQADSLK